MDTPSQSNGVFGGAATLSSGMTTEMVTLRSATPGSAGGQDAMSTIAQTLQSLAPDVRVIPFPITGQLALVGPPLSVRLARVFIAKVDEVPRQVVLDTEIFELDETVAKNLGLQLGTALLSTTYSEVGPPPNLDGTTSSFLKLQALTRTPLSFTAELNLLVQTGKGRVLADPRITTLSGRTASIKAGDNISILTTTAGSVGTIATTQVQSFQTGVTLDITPLVDDKNGITVTLHPVVNSLVGLNGGIPEISTRDTQTTVRLKDNETLVIGGLIQESATRTTTKIPVLGDLPLVGHLFRSDDINNARNELVIVITPHIVADSTDDRHTDTQLPTPPVPGPLPTLPPSVIFPSITGGTRDGLATLTLGANRNVPSPMPPASAPSPGPTPPAFAQTNVFTFGAPPQSNFARSSDPVTFYYATLSPTVVAGGTTVTVSAITSSNAASVSLRIGNQALSLTQAAPGQWVETFAFPGAALPPGQTSANLSLIGTRSDGATAVIAVPVNIKQ
jgi:hypothetical protein